ncbi:MAG: four helix bundle protein [Verrucomicrobia bacterium]|nr:four helix bundle protein [Verrucomicrobiota bacterium]
MPGSVPNQPSSDGCDRSGESDACNDRKRLRASGGYGKLRSYQVATVIYDATVSFCDRFIDKRSRTHDQMVQAARSCGTNIAEGSRAAATTSQTELRLVNVARASLEELLLDYEDFLRQRKLRVWAKDSPEALAGRAVGRQMDLTDQMDRTDPVEHYQAYARWLDHADPAVVANALICLLHQTNYLLDQQISALERDFVRAGGYIEQLAAARIAERQKQQHPTAPTCPHCGKPMALRMARRGPRAGSQFWGCSVYPDCTGTRTLEGADGSVRSD